MAISERRRELKRRRQRREKRLKSRPGPARGAGGDPRTGADKKSEPEKGRDKEGKKAS